MTNHQINVCKKILRYKKLDTILFKNDFSSYTDLQDAFSPSDLIFSDNRMDGRTTVTLSNAVIEELERRRVRMFDLWFTRCLSIIAIVISIIALLSQLGILRLQ